MDAPKIILFIDDNPVDRMLINRLLKKSGFEVFLAEDGTVGQRMAQENKPDLIILDILLPGISGIELCKYFKNNEVTRHTPVIFYTSIDTPKHLIDYASYGAQDYIQKAMPPEELLNSVRSILKI
jgi:DNA-binding response OmpR family regulator